MRSTNFAALVLALAGSACADLDLAMSVEDDAGASSSTETEVDAGPDPSEAASCQALLREVCGVTPDGTWRCDGTEPCEIAVVLSVHAPSECEARRTGPNALEACTQSGGGGETANDPGTQAAPGTDGMGPVTGSGGFAADTSSDGGVAGRLNPVCEELRRACCGDGNECAESHGCDAATEVADLGISNFCSEALGDEPSFPRCRP